MKAKVLFNLRRALAMVLVLCMAFGSMGLTAFAEDEKPAGSEWQIMKSNGAEVNFGEGSEEAGVDTTVSNKAVTSYNVTDANDSTVIVSKEITGSATNENEFDITLTVKTGMEVVGEVKAPNTATVILFDTSNSMTTKNDAIQTTRKRVDVAKEAAVSFLNQMNADAVADPINCRGHRWVTFVGYSKDINVAQNWYDVADAQGLADAKAFINDPNEAKDSHKLLNNSGTNLQGALVAANTLMNTIRDASGADTNYGEISYYFTVAMTDGQANTTNNLPNRYYNYPGDNAILKTVYEDTAAAGAVLNNSNANRYIYGIIYDEPNTTVYHENACTISGVHYHTEEECNSKGYAKTSKVKSGEHKGEYKFTGGHSGTIVQIYTVQNLMEEFANDTFSTGEGVDIATTFGHVADSMQVLSSAWRVKDPMGSRISFVSLNPRGEDDVDSSIASCTEAGILNWNLIADEPVSTPEDDPDDPFFTYVLSYKVTLDTESPDFIETTDDDEPYFYPTNGFTSLDYVFIGEDGTYYDKNLVALEDQSAPRVYNIAFTVPGVRGRIPEYTFAVEHYVMDDEGNYPETPTDSVAAAKYDRWTEFAAATYKDCYLAGLGENYQIDSYKFIEGTTESTEASIELTQDTVLKIYYSRIPVTVTVNKFLRNDTVDASGTRTSTAYTSIGSTSIDTYKGLTVTVPTDFLESYELVDTDEERSALAADSEKISDATTIENVQGGEVINLYYFTVKNEAAVEVYRTFEEWGYDFNEETGKYDTEMSVLRTWTETEPIASATKVEFPGEGYTYTIPPQAERSTDYSYVEDSAKLDGTAVSDDNSQVVVKPNENKTYRVDVTYKKSSDNRGPLYTVKVLHNYTLNEYKIKDGALATSPDVTKTWGVEGDSKTGYAGETVTLNEQRIYGGIDYAPTAQNAANGVVDGIISYTFDTGDTIELFYTKSIYPETTGVTVIAEFYTLTPVYSTTSAAITYTAQLDDRTETTYPEENATYVLYEGQKYNAIEPDHVDYLEEDENNKTYIAALDIDPANNVILLKYYRGRVEGLQGAAAGIIHNYYSNVKMVVDGIVKEVKDIFDGTFAPDKVYGKPRDSYDGFDFEPTYKENEYIADDPNQNLTAIYGGETVVVNYHRSYEDLKLIDINVIHNYYTRHMSVKENAEGELVADYYSDGIVPDGSSNEFTLMQGEDVVTELYKNMIVDIVVEEEYDGNEYAFDGKTQVSGITVSADGKTYTLNYYRDDELPQVQPTVTHTYFDINYSYVDGVEQEPVTEENEALRETVTGPAMYEGLVYEAVKMPLGYTLVKCVVNGEEIDIETLKDANYILTLDSTKANKVDYTYEKINAKLDEATIVVKHYYTTIDDYTGEVSGYIEGQPYTPLQSNYSSYATMTFTATHNHLGGEYPDEPTSDREQTVVLVSGDNGEINLYYVRHFNSAPYFAVIYHDGYSDAEPVTDGYTKNADFTVWTVDRAQFSREGYTFKGWSVASRSEKADEAFAVGNGITLALDKDGTLVVLDAEGKLIATADENGQLTLCSVEETGRNYHIELYAVWEKVTTSTGGGNKKDDDEVKEEVLSQPAEEEIVEEIVEEETPLSEAPEIVEAPEEEFEEMPEEEVPLADVPATGDNFVLWAILSLAAAITMAVMTIFRRKERTF